ncbi:MAG TPA: hypothetical protein VGO09_08250, partial [Flavisolibacter sp.]|nr:hypothetical protein [Flavisolibacter sp.]
MPTKLIFSFLKVSVTILFYLLCFFSFFFLITSVLTVTSKNKNEKILNAKGYNYEVAVFGTKTNEKPFVYSGDSIVRYQDIKDHYALQVKPRSGIGYYGVIIKLIFMGFGLAVLWNFKGIFKAMNLDHPFKQSIIKRLKILASLFIISDILKFIDYLVFNSF